MSARGEARRGALVAAAASLLGSGGPAALSARAVAGEAGVPLAAVSYYFGSLDELVRQAAEHLYDGYLRQAEALVVAREAGDVPAGGWPETVVRVWLDPAGPAPDPRRVRGTLTALAAAADSPALAPRRRRYDAELLGLVVRLLRLDGRCTGRTRVLLAALDGFALARLCGVDVSAPVAGPAVGPAVGPAADPAGRGGDPAAAELLAGLVADLLLVADDLAPVVGGSEQGQNSRAVGSSLPDSPT